MAMDEHDGEPITSRGAPPAGLWRPPPIDHFSLLGLAVSEPGTVRRELTDGSAFPSVAGLT
jgi:hypothetical protein